MKYAKIMVIIVIFVFAMSVSCAADTNNASISEDNSQMLLSLKNEITDDTSENSILAQTNNDETLSAQKNSEILRANEEGNYSDLRDDIFNNGGNLKKSYYRYQPGDGNTIVINMGGFTVNGNGAVIDMKGSNIRAFEVTGSGVTFKNLTIKNANFNDNGGAIYFSNDGTVSNCNFTGNTATGIHSSGGAVYFNVDGNVRNCNFTDNHATNGGAVFLNNGNVRNCNFTGNNATGNGGAIRIYSGTVSNCNFTDNHANGEGGAIGMVSGTVSNCNFTDNHATKGGAVFLNQGNVRNCNFTGNNATGNGGAINMGSGTVSNCNFTGNTVTGDGGAVYFGSSGDVRNCNFTGNTATTGSAIYFYSTSAQKSVSNSTFLNNRANAKDLQVTKNENNITIIFTGNNNILNAIYSNGDVSFSNVTYWGASGIVNTNSYTPSRTNKESGQNITVEIYGSDDNLVENVTLVTDDKGQVTYDFIKLRNGEYKYKAYHIKDCYYTYAEYKDTFTLNSDLGDFNRLQKYINGASENSILTLCRDYTFTIGSDENLVNGIVIDKPLTINGNGYAINALQKARIFNVNAGNVVLNNIAFTNATASGDGGAIYFSSSGTVSNCNFTGNNATDDGGAVFFLYTGDVLNCNFTGNTATRGGAIRMDSGSVTNCNFTGNTATIWGGAVYFINYGGNVLNCNFTGNNAIHGGAVYFVNNGYVLNCNFTGNTATRNGGAITIDSGNVINCNFSANTATDNGGAIFFDNHGNPSVVTNCNFSANTATRNGGAVYFNNQGSVSNCNFTGNNATRNGGAVYFNNQGSVSNCNFTGNNATYGGGAIWMNYGTVSNCNFSANTATGSDSGGGAVYFAGNGNVTNCNFTGNTATSGDGGAIYFSSSGSTHEVKNCNFINNKGRFGGAVCFADAGDVMDCNFTNNTASYDGGAICIGTGTVSNCNFTGNNATYGGAIDMGSGTVSNCNFTGNNATDGGAIWMRSGTVSNCNFTGNNATDGGAIWMRSGTVSNCNFTGNNATTGSAIYFYSTSAQKSVSNSTFLNNRANAKDLQVTKNENNITIIFTGNNNLLNAIYSNGDVSFSNVTYWGATGIVNTDTHKPSISNNAAGQNITVSIVINDKIDSKEVHVTDENGKIVLNRNVGDNYFIGVCHDTDSYYTEILNSTSKNTKFTVNVTNQTSNNRRVNITAKSNIPNEFFKGKLLFILPNSTQINANYTVNGTWWAVHEFDDAGDYVINASYIGLDGVIINNATISIRYDASVDVNNKTLDLFVEDTFNLNATTNPRNLPVNFTSSNPSVVTVDKNGEVVALSEGNATIIVSVGGDGKYAENSTIVTVTVTKVPTEIKVTNTTLNLEVNDEIPTGATLSPDDAGNLTYDLSNEGIVKIEDGEIIALKEGNVTITVSFKGNNKYLTAENKTINVTVSLKNARVSVNNATLDLFVDDTFTIVANTTPKGLKVTYKPDNSGIISVDNNGVVKALKEGNTTIIVSVGDNKVYAENTTTVTVTVRKIPTEITVNPASLDLFVGDETVINANLTPLGAGNVTFTSSDDSIVTVDNQGNVIAEGKGQAIITVSFAGDNKYAAAKNKTITVNVSLNDARVTVDNDTLDLKVDETYAIKATKYPDTILLDITYKSSDNSVASVDKNGIVTAISEGTAIITLEVGDDVIYAKNSTTVTVTVNKIPTDISIANATVNLNVDDEVSTGSTLNPEEAGNLTFTSSDESVAVVKDSEIIALKEGNAIITVSFKGNNKYGEAKNKTIKVTVKKLNPTMDAIADEITEGENATINVELPIDATGNVTTTVNGKTYSSPVDNGKAFITISGLEYGNYTLPVTYSGDDKYNSLTKDVNLTVKEDEIVVSAPDLTKYYSGNERFTVNVAYANGRAIAGKEVKITINGVTYKRTTDENGSALLNINLNSATYDTVVEVDNITVNSLVTILPTIEAEDVESKSKNIVFSATFIDSKGNYLKEGTDVSFNVDGVIYNSQVIGDKGLASIDLVLNHGRYIITSQNTVTGEYISNSIAVDLKDVDMILSGDEISVGDNATISVTLPGDATGNVTATINGKTYTNQVNNGKTNIIIPDLSAGNYTAHVTYLGDNNYNHATGNASISVSKVDALIDIEDSVITVGENATVIVILPGDATGDVRIGNEIVPLKNGTASAILTDLPVGINTIPVSYSGDDKYNPIESSADVVVNDKPAPDKKNLTIKATADEITEGDDAVIIVTGLENATGNVSAVVHGHVHSAPIVDGTANITIKGLVDNATAFVSYAGDDLYNSAVTSVNITVNKNTVNINAQNLTKYYKDPQKFTVTVTDAKGQAAANKTVEITINGVTYTKTTDENGTASLNINLNSGEYPVSVAVDDVVVNSTVFVKATIDSSDVVKVFRNDTQYYATFVDVNGTPTPNTIVSFNVNGVIYNRTTDDNGTAKLNINLPSGEYILTATNTVTGEKISNVIKVLSVIESSDLTKYFRNDSQFIVRIHTADGGYVGAGEEVRFNINGMIYAKKTNATGHAKININLPPGLYTITTYYKDFSQGNSIEVLPILSAEDLSMKYMDGSQFKAQLVDGKGKPYPKQDVTFNINGIFYNRATDSDGVAKLNIRLLAGQYIITSTYNGCNIANKVTIKS